MWLKILLYYQRKSPLLNVKVRDVHSFLHIFASMVVTHSLHIHLARHRNYGWKKMCLQRTREQICQSQLFIHSLSRSNAFSSVINLSIYSFTQSALSFIHLLTYSICFFSFTQIFVQLSCICPCIPSFIHSAICLNQFSIHMLSQLRRKVQMRWCNNNVTTAP